MIGDTIPHVISSVFPTLHTIPVLRLLTNRQFVIVLCTTCVSYPLSLYRDISKLSRASGFALVGMLVIVFSVLIEGPHAPEELKGPADARFSIIRPQIFEAIGVIRYCLMPFCRKSTFLTTYPSLALLLCVIIIPS